MISSLLKSRTNNLNIIQKRKAIVPIVLPEKTNAMFKEREDVFNNPTQNVTYPGNRLLNWAINGFLGNILIPDR